MQTCYRFTMSLDRNAAFDPFGRRKQMQWALRKGFVLRTRFWSATDLTLWIRAQLWIVAANQPHHWLLWSRSRSWRNEAPDCRLTRTDGTRRHRIKVCSPTSLSRRVCHPARWIVSSRSHWSVWPARAAMRIFRQSTYKKIEIMPNRKLFRE